MDGVQKRWRAKRSSCVTASIKTTFVHRLMGAGVDMKKTEAKKALAARRPPSQTELEAPLKGSSACAQAATQQLQDNSKLKTVRRGIARARTLMHQKAQAAAGNKGGQA
jgi:hypothetical protein